MSSTFISTFHKEVPGYRDMLVALPVIASFTII